MDTKEILDPQGREGETIHVPPTKMVNPGDLTAYRVLCSGPIVVAWVGGDNDFGRYDSVTLCNGRTAIAHEPGRRRSYTVAMLTGIALREAGSIDPTDDDLCAAAICVAEGKRGPFTAEITRAMFGREVWR